MTANFLCMTYLVPDDGAARAYSNPLLDVDEIVTTWWNDVSTDHRHHSARFCNTGDGFRRAEYSGLNSGRTADLRRLGLLTGPFGT